MSDLEPGLPDMKRYITYDLEQMRAAMRMAEDTKRAIRKGRRTIRKRIAKGEDTQAEHDCLAALAQHEPVLFKQEAELRKRIATHTEGLAIVEALEKDPGDTLKTIALGEWVAKVTGVTVNVDPLIEDLTRNDRASVAHWFREQAGLMTGPAPTKAMVN